MHDRPSLLARIREQWWDGKSATERIENIDRRSARPRRALIEHELSEPLIPEYEPYQPPPSKLKKWWDKEYVEYEDVQFGAFIVMLCLAVPLALTGVLFVVDGFVDLGIPWLFTTSIVLLVGTGVSAAIAYGDDDGEGWEVGGGG